MNDELNEPIENPSDPTDDQPPVDPEPQEPTLDDRFNEFGRKVQNDTQAWLGRRLQQNNEEIMAGIANLLNQHKVPTGEEDPTDPWQDPDGWYAKKRQAEIKAEQDRIVKNQQIYTQTLESDLVKHQDPKVHKAVLDLLDEKGDQGHRVNIGVNGQPVTPTEDAVLNYNRALREVYERQLAPVDIPNPLEGNDPPKNGLGVSKPSGASETVVKMPKLSKHASKLISHSGWGADKVKKVLGK